MGVRIVVADGEPIALAIQRFRRVVERSGVRAEMRKRGLLLQANGCYFEATHTRRAKKFRQRFKAREATLRAIITGEQVTASSRSELMTTFWKRTGKP